MDASIKMHENEMELAKCAEVLLNIQMVPVWIATFFGVLGGGVPEAIGPKMAYNRAMGGQDARAPARTRGEVIGTAAGLLRRLPCVEGSGGPDEPRWVAASILDRRPAFYA